MAGEWEKRKIGTLGCVITGKTPPTVDPANFDGNYPFITIPDLDGRAFIDRTERTLSERGADLVRTCLLPPGAVMISCIATVGRCGITTRPSFTNQQINSVIPNADIDSHFLYYLFTQLGHELERAGGGGSVYTNVSKNRFSDIEVLVPVDLKQQRAIAHILGTLDDKIELNRRMSETLEAIARAVFESWFVRFDPVRRNMARKGRGQPSPGLRLPSPSGRGVGGEGVVESCAFDHLFPDSFQDSELGKIPKGWRVGRIGDLAHIASGKRPEVRFAEPSEEGCVPLWGGNGPMGFVPEPLIVEPIVLTGRVGTLGSVFRIMEPCWPSDNTLVLRATDKAAFEYLFLQLRQVDFESLNRGSTQPLLTQSDLKSQELLVPAQKVLKRFSGFVTPLYGRIDQLDAESRTLAAIRDTLLPKLISGEIRLPAALRERAAQAEVKDAERITGRTV